MPFGPRLQSQKEIIDDAWQMLVHKESKVYSLKDVRARLKFDPVQHTSPDHRTWCIITPGKCSRFDITGQDIFRTFLKPALDPVGDEVKL